jgi:hypothetical protein
MKVKSLVSKLKLAGSNIITENGNLMFKINKKTYFVDTNNSDTVLCFFYERGFDQASQETDRRFFENFNQVLRHSIR